MKEQINESVRREIVLDAPRPRVWDLVCDPRELATWFAQDVAFDVLEPGAEGVVTVEDRERRHAVVDEVDPGRRLALRWAPLDDPDGPETLVELTLDDTADGRTRLVVIEVPMTRVRAVSDAFLIGTDGIGGSGGAVSGPTMALAGACR